jgi:DNA-binding NarL/FixJ family response regulator
MASPDEALAATCRVSTELAATRRLRAELPAVKVVVLTAFGADASILDAISTGALGYRLEDTGIAELRTAIQRRSRTL